MTLAMPDSINIDQLPPGYDAYLGYVDGRWPTAAALEVKFPKAELVLLTVTGATTAAHGIRVAPGIDVEPGDVLASTGAAWAGYRLQTALAIRPVIYASVQGKSGYGMSDVLRYLAASGIDRSKVRLLSAHYGQGAHICGPGSCGEISVEMDGTQWTNAFLVQTSQGLPVNIDMSMLADDFFTGSTGLNRTERLMQELGIVQAGMTGEMVKTVQGLCVARGITTLPIDGIFGGETLSVVMSLQERGHVAIDGIVGPQTWPVLLGVA